MLGSDIHGANLTSIVYGQLYPDDIDASMDWLEASSIYRESISWDCPGVTTLENNPQLNRITQRAGRVYPQDPRLTLPDSAELSQGLQEAIDRRQSSTVFGATMSKEQLAGLLRYSSGFSPATYDESDGTVQKEYAKIHRRVPSAGGLHPLDLVVYCRSINGLSQGLYAYVSSEDLLASLGPDDESSLLELDNAISPALLMSDGVTDCSCIIFITAMLWRSRFKYGHRGTRFAFLEAGHVMQNILLIAADYKIAARPLGGFIDQEVNALIPGMNGTDSMVLYAAAIG